ncbi:MAG: thrombospondin type 3 repeat-containing protein, partial [Pseudomonadota bacterium]
MLYRLFLRLTLVVFIASSITACGGGGGSSDSPEPTRSPAPTPAPAPTPTPAPAPPPPQDNGNDGDGQNDTVHIVSGSGVKGPLANAMVRVYEVDPNQSDFRGTLIAESSTDNQAKIENLEVSDSLAGPFIIEFTAVDETVDLSTGIAPFLGTLSTIVTKTEISSEQPIYATPLTTIVEKLIAAGAGSALLGGNENGTIDTDEVIDAIASAEAIVRSTFGFGISDQVNILTTPAIIDGPISSEQLSAIAEYRAAAEGFASVISYLSQRNTSQIDTDTIVSDLARDLADGVLDGSFGERSTSSYDLDDLVSQSNLLNDLSIDSIDGTRTVDDIVQILLDERSATGFTDVTVSGFQSIQGPFLVAPIALAADIDGDGVFNSVDLDDDGDSVADTLDAFPHDETESVDTDNDGIGNNRDTDDDGDGIPDANDDFPLDASQQENNDQDNDGVEDIFDAFPNDASESHDLDGDGIGDNTDDDIDGDGVANSIDVFPYNSNETIDTDNDGVGNNTDTDDDNDGVSDDLDAFPLDASEVTDTDGDGVGNNADSDDDNDGVPDSSDAFPLDSLASVFNDADGDGWPVGQDDDDSNPNSPTIAFIDPDQDGLASDGGLAPDDDDDNDGVPDTFDWAPNDPSEWSDVDGDSIGDNADSDKDGDGFENSEDKFPSNPEEWADTDNDGIGDNEDSDADNDGIDNDVDAFPLDSTEWSDNDNDGIGNNADNDDDNDGVDDSIDAFPFDPNESADFDGDGIGNNEDNDDDNDNVIDTEDAFPFNQNESKDTDGDGIGDNEDNNSEIDDGSSNTVSEPSPLPPPPESETVSISGAGVKGPMAFADVALYRLDMSKNDYKGDVIGTTSTNEFAQIIDLSLPSDETPPFLMEIKGVEGSTIDISTDLYPVIDELRTLITQQMLDDGISIYATPLTTMATDMALSSADSNVSPFGGNQDGVATTEEVLAAIPVAAERVKSTLGFGIDENVELFTTPPVIDADTKSDSDKASAAALRSAVEAVTAIIYEMKQSGNSSSTTNDILV